MAQPRSFQTGVVLGQWEAEAGREVKQQNQLLNQSIQEFMFYIFHMYISFIHKKRSCNLKSLKAIFRDVCSIQNIQQLLFCYVKMHKLITTFAFL